MGKYKKPFSNSFDEAQSNNIKEFYHILGKIEPTSVEDKANNYPDEIKMEMEELNYIYTFQEIEINDKIEKLESKRMYYSSNIEKLSNNEVCDYNNIIKDITLCATKLELNKAHYKNCQKTVFLTYWLNKYHSQIKDNSTLGYIIENLKNEHLEIEKKLNKLRNKRRKYPIEFMEKIKEIELTAKPKQSQINCVILANRELEIYNETELLDFNNMPSQLAYDIMESYKAQKNKL